MNFDLWWGDVRFASRNALRRPGFTVLVTMTLALGLGVNSAVFALIDSVLLRPLPYRDPSRIVFIWQTLPRLGVPEVEATPFDYEAWRGLRSMASVAMMQYGSFTLTGGADEPERVRGARVTASLMPLLGIAPAIGRGFTGAEDADDSPAVVVLSDGVWRRRFGADPAAVGRSVEIDGVPRTIVGVMPRGAAPPGALTEESQLWLPMRMTPAERASEISHSYTFVGRLAPGVTLAQASAEFEAYAGQLSAERPSHRDTGARLVPVAEQTVRAIRPALVVAAAGVGLLLLVAAANTSTLLVARASSRRQELAIRAALGATGWRLLSLSLAESLVYAIGGGIAGLVLGSWTLRGLIPLFGASLPRAYSVGIDGRAAAFTAAVSIAIGCTFGIVAAYRPQTRLADSIGGGTRVAATRATRGRSALVIAQVALAVVLLGAAGLMVSSVMKLSRVRAGFDPANVLTFKVALSGPRYDSAAVRTQFVRGMLDRLTATAGIREAGVVSAIPFGGIRNATMVTIEGRPWLDGQPPIVIDQRYVSPGYFDVLRIPLIAGRGVTAADDSRSEQITLVNRAMARRYFGNESPINRRVRVVAGFDAGVWFRIVGVVDDVRHISLTREPVAEMYRPIAQAPVPVFTVAAKTAADPAAMAAAARAAVHAQDPMLPIFDIQTMDNRIASSFAQTRAMMLLLLATAVLAAALSGVAIYGSIWYAVVQRMPEIGIRMALGASRGSVFRSIVGSAVATALAGTAVGIAAAISAGPLVRALLFDTRTTDPLTYSAVAGAVLAMAACAAIVPAIRAIRVDPLAALRN